MSEANDPRCWVALFACSLTPKDLWDYTHCGRFMADRLRSAATVVAVLAVAGLPLLPPEHVHLAGIEGRTAALVHAHEDVLGDGGDSAPGAGLHTCHANHGLAVFLSTHYNSVSKFISQPVAVLVAHTDVAPVFRFIGIRGRLNARATHGPPGSTWLTRGPPFVS